MELVTRSTAVETEPDRPASEGTAGYFAPGNPATNTPATVPGYEWFNMVQAELKSICDAASVTLDKEKKDQVATAIQNMIDSATSESLTTTTIDNATFAADLTTHDMVRLTLKGTVTFTAPPSGFGGFVGVLVNDGDVGIDYSAFSLKTVEFNGASGAKHTIAIVRDGVDTIIKIEEITADA